VSEIQELIELAQRTSTADGCLVLAAEHSETNLRFADNALTTNGQMRTRSLTVIATFDRSDGTHAGVVTRSVTTPEEVEDLVRAAELAARDAGPSDDAAPLVADYPHEDDYTGEAGSTDARVFEAFAADLGREFDRWRASGQRLYGFAEHQLTSHYLASSTGLRRRYDQPDGRLEVNAKTGDGTGSAWFSQHYPDFDAVDVGAVSAELERRLGWGRRTVDLPAGRYETLLPPTAVADLMIDAFWAASARDADEGRSVYSRAGSTRIGERLSDLPITMRSDPDHPGLECAPFQLVTRSGDAASVFDNGAPNPAIDWLRDGTLTNLIRPRGYAARTGAEPALAVDNLIIEGGGTRSIDDLVADTERGLLLTCLWYLREVDPQTLLVTGLTRDGVYLVEHGTVTAAVNNFRFNESPVDLWRRAGEIGRSEQTLSREWSDYFTRTSMPALRIPDFNMSTVSRAR
jgi:predicted Zn-dependent protease